MKRLVSRALRSVAGAALLTVVVAALLVLAFGVMTVRYVWRELTSSTARTVLRDVSKTCCSAAIIGLAVAWYSGNGTTGWALTGAAVVTFICSLAAAKGGVQ